MHVFAGRVKILSHSSRRTVDKVQYLNILSHECVALTFRCPLKNKQLSKSFLYFRPKSAAHQGSSAGTVLDPLLDHIGNIQNSTAESVQFLIQL